MKNPNLGGLIAVAIVTLAACGQQTSREQAAVEFINPEEHGVAVFEPTQVTRVASQIADAGVAPTSEQQETYDPFYVQNSWKEAYGDLSLYSKGTAQNAAAKAINNHPVGKERKTVAYVNGFRHLILNAEKPLDLLPVAQAKAYGVSCLVEVVGQCLVGLEELRAKYSELKSKEFYSRLRDQMASYESVTAKQTGELRDAVLTYVADQQIRLPKAPYSEILQLQGNLEGLDPHSGLMLKSDYERSRGDGNTNLVGMGANIFVMDGALIVKETFDGSGARDAGILPGDLIVAVNGVGMEDPRYSATGKIDLQAVIQDIKGSEGSVVRLTIEREEVRLEKEVVRKKVSVKNVVLETTENADHLRYRGFTADSAKAFKDAVDESEQSSSKALILDLRGNGGGSVEVLVEIAKHLTNAPDQPLFYNLFVKDGVSSFGGFRMADATTESQKPMILLIDADSASASEAVAANLKYLERAIVIGDTSLGKGSMQQVEPLFGSGVYFRATTGLYYTARHYTPQYAGVVPDVEALQMPHRPELAADSIRERDLPLVIPVKQGREAFAYEASSEKQAQVQCAQDQDIVLKAQYLKRAEKIVYPGDYQMQLAQTVVKECL